MIDTILTRIYSRLGNEEYDKAVVEELCQTAIDRLCLRLGVVEEEFPRLFYGIAVEATVKAFRRLHYEGITSEVVANISTNFISDILDEYSAEIAEYKQTTKVVRFL